MRGLLLIGALSSGCTLNVGAPPDAGACTASPDFFVSDVYPRYLVANQCGSGACHAFEGGHGVLRLRTPEMPLPSPGQSIDAWPMAWRENYLSAIHLLDCDAPLESRLLIVPEGRNNLHPPGPVVLDRTTAAQVIQTWVSK
jgi:hypothetical protein